MGNLPSQGVPCPWGSLKIPLIKSNRGLGPMRWYFSLPAIISWFHHRNYEAKLQIDGSEIRRTSWYGRYLPLFTGFYTSQVVQDFFHQQYHWCLLFQCAIDFTRKDSYPKKMNMDTQQKSTIFCSLFISTWKEKNTPPKVNMESQNGGLEDDFPFQLGDL